MHAGEDIARASHVGGELIDLVETAVDGIAAVPVITQIRDHEVVGVGFGELRMLEVDAAHPKALALETRNKVRTDEPARTANKRCLHDGLRNLAGPNWLRCSTLAPGTSRCPLAPSERRS